MVLVMGIIALLILIYLMNINENLDKILKELMEHKWLFKNLGPRKEEEKK